MQGIIGDKHPFKYMYQLLETGPSSCDLQN